MFQKNETILRNLKPGEHGEDSAEQSSTNIRLQ